MSKLKSIVCGAGLGLLILSLPTAGRASDARVEGLGINGIYVDDYEGFQLFPTVIARTNNLVSASLGSSQATSTSSSADNSFEVIASGKKETYWTFSIYLRGESPFLNTLQSYIMPFSDGDNDFNGPDIAHQQYDIGWAKQFDTVTFGVRVEQARSKLEAGSAER